MSSQPRIRLGRKGEDVACSFLKEQGYTVLERNWRCKRGEIDIIALDGDTLVFVEVRSRTQYDFGFPQESVKDLKKRRLLDAAKWYLTVKGLWNRMVRFDVIGILFEKGDIKIFHEQDILWESEISGSCNTYWQPW